MPPDRVHRPLVPSERASSNPHSGHTSSRRRSPTSTTTRSGSKRTFLTHTPGRRRSLESAVVTRTLSSQAVDLQQPAAWTGGRRRVADQRATSNNFLRPRKTCSGAESRGHLDHIDARSTGKIQQRDTPETATQDVALLDVGLRRSLASAFMNHQPHRGGRPAPLVHCCSGAVADRSGRDGWVVAWATRRRLELRGPCRFFAVEVRPVAQGRGACREESRTDRGGCNAYVFVDAATWTVEGCWAFQRTAE
jgi:hypothetical protein